MNLAKFCEWIIRHTFEGGDIDGGAVQDYAVKHGILVKTTYDPAIHGEPVFDVEPGDDWYVFSDTFEASLRNAE